jgi:hypothetical protein
VCRLRNGCGALVSDLGRERSHQHQGVLRQLADARLVGA